MRLGEELLHRVDEVADAAGALVALLRGGGGGGGALVLQRVEAVPVQRHLLLELVQEIRRDSVHLPAAAVRRRASVFSGFPAAGSVAAAAAAVPRGATVVHAGEGATGDGVVCGRHGHGHHHALRVDGAAWRAAVVAVQGAALRGAEEVGWGSGVAMVDVVVQGGVAVGIATGVSRDCGRELEVRRAATGETFHVPGWRGVAVLIEVLRGRP